jgi:hypothetical protein
VRCVNRVNASKLTATLRFEAGSRLPFRQVTGFYWSVGVFSDAADRLK